MKPNPLLIVSLVFAASFSGRAINIASAATKARDGEAPMAAHAAASAEHASQSDAADLASGPPANLLEPAAPPKAAVKIASPAGPAAPPVLPDANQTTLLASIKERSAWLDQREAALAERANLLEVAEKRIDEKIAALSALKGELEHRLSFAETAAQDDIAQLSKMYENMKPQRAGELFNTMDPSFAAGFLTEMNNESAALILANMETAKAYAVSVMIAGRNATVNR